VPLNLSGLKPGDLLLCIEDEPLGGLSPYVYAKAGRIYKLTENSAIHGPDVVVVTDDEHILSCPSKYFIELDSVTAFDKLMYGIKQ
jgi:hypothetical protein